MAKRTETSKLKSKLKKTAVIDKNEKFYVYGIYLNDKCIYIGSTNHIEQRWGQHKEDLLYHRHINKSLQKAYNETPQFEYKVLMEVPVDNDLLKFFCEFLWNSIIKPKCNKCILMQGRSRIILPRIKDEKLAQLLLDTITQYYKVSRD